MPLPTNYQPFLRTRMLARRRGLAPQQQMFATKSSPIDGMTPEQAQAEAFRQWQAILHGEPITNPMPSNLIASLLMDSRRTMVPPSTPMPTSPIAPSSIQPPPVVDTGSMLPPTTPAAPAPAPAATPAVPPQGIAGTWMQDYFTQGKDAAAAGLPADYTDIDPKTGYQYINGHLYAGQGMTDSGDKSVRGKSYNDILTQYAQPLSTFTRIGSSGAAPLSLATPGSMASAGNPAARAPGAGSDFYAQRAGMGTNSDTLGGANASGGNPAARAGSTMGTKPFPIGTEFAGGPGFDESAGGGVVGGNPAGRPTGGFDMRRPNAYAFASGGRVRMHGLMARDMARMEKTAPHPIEHPPGHMSQIPKGPLRLKNGGSVRRAGLGKSEGVAAKAAAPGYARGGWIRGAIKHPGAFSAAAKRAGESTAQFAHEHEHDPGKLGDRARLAETLMAMHHKDGGRIGYADGGKATLPGFEYDQYLKYVAPYAGVSGGGDAGFTQDPSAVLSKDQWDALPDSQKYAMLRYTATTGSGNGVVDTDFAARPDDQEAFRQKFGKPTWKPELSYDPKEGMTWGYGDVIGPYDAKPEEFLIDPSRVLHLPDGRWVYENNNVRKDFIDKQHEYTNRRFNNGIKASLAAMAAVAGGAALADEGFGGAGLTPMEGTGAFDMGGSAGVFDSFGNPLTGAFSGAEPAAGAFEGGFPGGLDTGPGNVGTGDVFESGYPGADAGSPGGDVFESGYPGNQPITPEQLAGNSAVQSAASKAGMSVTQWLSNPANLASAAKFVAGLAAAAGSKGGSGQVPLVTTGGGNVTANGGTTTNGGPAWKGGNTGGNTSGAAWTPQNGSSNGTTFTSTPAYTAKSAPNFFDGTDPLSYLDNVSAHWSPNASVADLVAEAAKAGSPQEQEAAAGRAKADVAQQFEAAAQQERNRLIAQGVNPDASGAGLELARLHALDQAKAAAGGANAARLAEKERGFSKRAAAAGLSLNDASQGLTADQINAGIAGNRASLAGNLQTSRANINSNLYNSEQNREFQSGENAASRAFQGGENELNRQFQSGEAAAGRNFAGNQAELNRQFTSGENAATREFQGGQNAADRDLRAQAINAGITQNNISNRRQAARDTGAGVAAGLDVASKLPWGSIYDTVSGWFADGGPVKPRMRGLNYDSGGDVSGPGTSTSDSIPAKLSDGEFVVNAEGVELLDKLAPGFLEKANERGLRIRSIRQRGMGARA